MGSLKYLLNLTKLIFGLVLIIQLSACGKTKTSKSAPISPETTCEEKGEDFVFQDGKCIKEGTEPTAEEKCVEAGEDYTWDGSICVLKASLTDEQDCILKGSQFAWEKDLCVEKAAVVEIKDPNFERCILNTTISKGGPKVDADADGKLRVDEAKNITKLKCNGQNIQSLEGVEKLSELTELQCSGNELGVMPDFSKLKKLNKLVCENNYFSDADCGRLKNLQGRGLESLKILKQKDGRILSCDLVEMVAHIDMVGADNITNDVWGFRHNDENYALYGDVSKVYVVKILEEAPYYKKIAEMPRGADNAEIWTDPSHSMWGEYRYFKKDSKSYIYAATEGNSNDPSLFPALRAWDVTDVKHPKLVVFENLPLKLRSTHNIILDQENEWLIAFGGTDHDGEAVMSRGRMRKPSLLGARIYDISNPVMPKLIRTVGKLYIHDGQIRGNKLFVAHGSSKIHGENNTTTDLENRFSVYDISRDIVVDQTVIDVPMLIDQNYPSGYCHNISPTEDGNYVIVTGETSVDDQMSFWKLNYITGETGDAKKTSGLNLQGQSFSHNAFVDGNRIYVSHYSKGVQILDIVDAVQRDSDGSIEDIKKIELLWSYDTFPEHNAGRFGGSWGIYPYLENSRMFFATDMTTGLYIFKKSARFLETEGQ